MMKFLMTSAITALTFTGAAQATVLGQFVDLGTRNVDTDFNPVTSEQVRLWGFQITATANVASIDFSAIGNGGSGGFSGDFLQSGGQPAVRTSSDLPTFGPFVQPDTWFFAPVVPGVSGQLVDSATTLQGFYTTGSANPTALANTPTIVAYFSQALAAPAPTFLGGNAVQNGQVEAILIPEPATLGLLAAGTLLIVRRRRAD